MQRKTSKKTTCEAYCEFEIAFSTDENLVSVPRLAVSPQLEVEFLKLLQAEESTFALGFFFQ